MTPDAARVLAGQLRDQAADHDSQSTRLRENANMLVTWANIMERAVEENFRDIMPADMIAILDAPKPAPAPAEPQV